jgi:hypothetical protein
MSQPKIIRKKISLVGDGPPDLQEGMEQKA